MKNFLEIDTDVERMVHPYHNQPPRSFVSFPKLPKELQMKICEEVLKKRKPIRPRIERSNKPLPVPGLLGVSREIRSECLKTYYSKNHFIFSSTRAAWLWIRRIGLEGRKHLCHLVLYRVHNTVWGALLMPLLADCKKLHTLEIYMHLVDLLAFHETDSLSHLHGFKEASFVSRPPGCSLTQHAVYQGRKVSAEELDLILINLRSQLTSVGHGDSFDSNIKASMLIGIGPWCQS